MKPFILAIILCFSVTQVVALKRCPAKTSQQNCHTSFKCKRDNLKEVMNMNAKTIMKRGDAKFYLGCFLWGVENNKKEWSTYACIEDNGSKAVTYKEFKNIKCH